MPSERTWHKGPPPHVGWWNASRIGATDCWRWWDGSHWSVVAVPDDPDDEVAWSAATPTEHGSILWTDYWPENARVPRIDPRKEPSNAQ